MILLDRIKVLTDADEFLKVFPDKSNLVKPVVNSEMILLFTNIRKDTNFNKLFKMKSIESFKESLVNYLGEPVISTSKFGIIEGRFYTNHEITDTEVESLYKLLKGNTEFQLNLFNLHKPVIKKFIIENDGCCCGNILLHCSEEDFIATLSSIDFPFTTVENLLTALRSDLVFNTDTFGRIRTSNDVFIINIPESVQECCGVFVSKL